MTGFKHALLKQLTDQQVRFAPPARRLEQAAQARKLLAEIDPGKRYPYQFVCFRITGYRPEGHADVLIDGLDLADDLQEMIRLLDDILTVEEVSQRLNVSTKTIRRWRKFGLEGKLVMFQGKRQLGFRQSAVDAFLVRNADRVERGGRFSQMSDAEREEVLRRAKRLSRARGGSLTEVSRRIARRLNRSVEAIRYTIKNFDREHPDQALFPNLTGPLNAESKQIIYNSFRRGITVDTLARQFQRTRTSMYRVINEVRARRLLEQPLDYMPSPDFDDRALESVILAPMPDAEVYEAKRRSMHAPKDVPPELASCYEYPLLSKEQEQHQFRKMNYLKFKASQLRNQMRKEGDEFDVDPSRVRIQTLREIEELQAEANVVKEMLIQANMRLVVNIAKKHSAQAENFFELLSDGNMSLIRAVEKFDYYRGFKFSTYASWAIMKNFARSIPEDKHRRERFITGHEDMFDATQDKRTDEHEMLATQERATHSVNRLLEFLEPREREIIRMRAGMDENGKNVTLEEIGRKFGITKERVRQLNARAMSKLRAIAKEKDFDIL
ncbi:MAG TPA: sigma-70 family RNA polymerase sigma factor [Gemmataceae bacterium]|nr:sigma-70 family RNA polymerase sigma factor [Gemmataceae bacterium]